jgi:hypothetical protein
MCVLCMYGDEIWLSVEAYPYWMHGTKFSVWSDAIMIRYIVGYVLSDVMAPCL